MLRVFCRCFCLVCWCCLLLAPLKVRSLPADAYVAVDIPASHRTSLDGIAGYIRSNYKGTEAQLWALYSWEASFIRYNLAKRNVQLSITNADDLALWTVKHREGVCANFASLFYAVARRLGVETYLVGGYAVTHNNVRDDGHEWCACIIDGRPFMFDPTWGGGYMLNQEQYVHRLSADYFMVPPAKMVLTHMPEDPLFQFLDYPHYYDEIDNPGADHPVPVYFNWRDSLASYNAQDTLARLGGQLARMRANGFANDWIAKEIVRLQHNYEAYLLNRMVDVFNLQCVPAFQALHGSVYGNGPQKSKAVLQSDADKLRDQLDGISTKLDDTDFTSDEILSGAGQVQSQVQKMLEGLRVLESAIRKR